MGVIVCVWLCFGVCVRGCMRMGGGGGVIGRPSCCVCLCVCVRGSGTSLGRGRESKDEKGESAAREKGEVADPAVFTDQLSKGAI